MTHSKKGLSSLWGKRVVIDQIMKRVRTKNNITWKRVAILPEVGVVCFISNRRDGVVRYYEDGPGEFRPSSVTPVLMVSTHFRRAPIPVHPEDVEVLK